MADETLPISADEPDTVGRARLTTGQRIALAALLLLGLVLRGWNLGGIPLWVDEAESAINALTIQQHGVPIDRYLDLPIFENVLTEPWPGHPEYEFRDSSYSDRGVAIYHGWLPLYSIAASEVLFGVRPDVDVNARAVVHDVDAVVRRTIAPRVPAVLYGMLFLTLLFVAAREMYGTDAGFAALLFGAIAEPLVLAGRQARYYSPTLAFSVACCLLTWRVYRHGRLRDFLIAGVLFGALFHTHILSFFILCGAFVLVLPWVVRRPGWFTGLAGMGLVMAALVVPWVIGTGFLRQVSHVPPARTMLTFPADLLSYPLHRIEFTLVAILSLAWVAAVAIQGRKMPVRFRSPVEGHGFVFVFLIAWGGIALLAFTFLVPAASYFIKRLSLSVMGPGVLLTAIFAAAAARAIAPRRSVLIASAGAAAMLVIGRMVPTQWPYAPVRETPQHELLGFLREQTFAPDARLYATPNDHLTLQYLTGLPFQCVAPVRKTFLDAWPGEVVIVEPVSPYINVNVHALHKVAGQDGIGLSETLVQAWRDELTSGLVRREIAGRVAEVRPPLGELPPWASRYLDEQKEITARLILGGHSPTRENAAVFRGQPMAHWGEWWPIFFYRFVDWPGRARENLNYAARARTATAHVLRTSGWVVLRCPPLGEVATTRAVAPSLDSDGRTATMSAPPATTAPATPNPQP